MYNQLLQQYTINEYLKYKQSVHTALYITPNGKIFDCRQNGVIGHASFATELYNNYSQMMQIHKDIDFNTELSEFILDDNDFNVNDVKNFYIEQYNFLQYEDMNLYTLLRLDCLGLDNLPVQDLGFVRVSINRGELPVINLPMPIFNGKSMTNAQHDTLLEVLNYNTISHIDYEPKQIIYRRIKENKLMQLRIEQLKQQSSLNL